MFLFVFNELQIVNKPMSGWKKEWTEPSSFETCHGRIRKKK